MSKKKIATVYSPAEEKANTFTHFLGFIISLIVCIYVIATGGNYGTNVFVGTLIFLATSMVLYACSTLYHFVKNEQRKRLFKKLDHMAIYLLIAGTFTPFTLGILWEDSGQVFFYVSWSIALLGVAFKLFFTGKYEIISLASYLGMGWLGFLMFGDIGDLLGQEVVNWMLYGGACYSLGVVFYVMRKLKYHHAIWHLFVLGGTAFHGYAIINFVLPY